MMAGKADEPALSCLLGGFDGSARSEDLGYFFLFIDGMHLPEIKVIGVEALQREMEFLFRLLASSLHGFCRDENFLAERWQHFAIDLFGATGPITVGVIKIVNPQVVSPQHDRLGFLF